MQSLRLGQRRIDVFFIVIFSAFTITSLISDLLPIRMRTPLPFTRKF